MKTGDRVRGKTLDAKAEERFNGSFDDGPPIDWTPDYSWHEGTLIIRSSDLFGGFTMYEIAEDGAMLDPATIVLLDPRGDPPVGASEETDAERIHRILGIEDLTVEKFIESGKTVTKSEAPVTLAGWVELHKGDKPGHPFRGNQWNGRRGGKGPAPKPPAKKVATKKAVPKKVATKTAAAKKAAQIAAHNAPKAATKAQVAKKVAAKKAAVAGMTPQEKYKKGIFTEDEYLAAIGGKSATVKLSFSGKNMAAQSADLENLSDYMKTSMGLAAADLHPAGAAIGSALTKLYQHADGKLTNNQADIYYELVGGSSKNLTNSEAAAIAKKYGVDLSGVPKLTAAQEKKQANLNVVLEQKKVSQAKQHAAQKAAVEKKVAAKKAAATKAPAVKPFVIASTPIAMANQYTALALLVNHYEKMSKFGSSYQASELLNKISDKAAKMTTKQGQQFDKAVVAMSNDMKIKPLTVAEAKAVAAKNGLAYPTLSPAKKATKKAGYHPFDEGPGSSHDIGGRMYPKGSLAAATQDTEIRGQQKAKMSPEQQKAWSAYTDGIHDEMNGLLRTGRVPQSYGATPAEVKKMTKHLTESFDTVGQKTKKKETLYRGTGSHSIDGKVGQAIKQPGVTSASVDKNDADSFSSGTPVITIHVPPGVKYLFGTDYEAEIILPPSVFFVINKVNRFGQATEVTVRA